MRLSRQKLGMLLLAGAWFVSESALAQTGNKYRCQKNGKQAVCVASQRSESMQVSGGGVGVSLTGASLESQRQLYEEQAKAGAYANLAPVRSNWWWCSDVGWKLFGPYIRQENVVGGGKRVIEERQFWFEYMEGVNQNSCDVTVQRTQTSDGAWSRHQFWPQCPDWSWTYEGPDDVRQGPGVCYQYCPANTEWNAWTQSCKPVLNLYDPSPRQCPANGNPIHPLTGSKSQEEILLPKAVGREGLSVRYDSRPRLPFADNDTYTVPSVPSSFSELWRSSLHKSLSKTQFGNNSSFHFERGGGLVTTFTYDAAGYTPASPSTSDRIFGWGSYYLYRDAGARALDSFLANQSLAPIQARAYASGGKLTYTYNTSATPQAPVVGLLTHITDQFGRTLTFEYAATAEGSARVQRIIDAAGQAIVVGYDAAGNLSQVSWPDGSTRQFLYERPGLPWALTGLINETNQRIGTYGYSDEGLAILTEGALGTQRFSASYGQPPRRKVTESYDASYDAIVRRHGWVLPTGVVLATPSGDVAYGAQLVGEQPFMTTRSQPAGSGCAASTSTLGYDANGNVVSRDDFNGSRTCAAYDLGRNLETARVEGLGNSTDCSSVTSAGAALPTGARKVSSQWHPDWRLQTRVAEPGKLTTTVYNGQPDPFAGGATASCAPSDALLPDNKPIAVVCKRVEQSTLDTNGTAGVSATSAVAPGHEQVSLLLHMDGAEGATVFDDRSANPKVVATHGSVTTTTATSKFGGASMNTQGANRWLTVPHAPELDLSSGDFTIEMWVKPATANSHRVLYNKANSTGYYASLMTLDNTNRLAFRAYDGTNSLVVNLTGTTVLAVNTWHHVAVTRSGSTFTAWVNGQPEATTSSAATLRSNASDPVTIGAHSDGSYGLDGWIDEVRVSKGVARYGSAFTPATLAFTNATTSMLEASVPARIWKYTYNQHGQVLTETDPRGKTTTYTYYTDTAFTGTDPDAVGHTIGDLKSVTNAAGHVTQYGVYDKAGRLRQSTDPNGVVTTHAYDLRGRLLSSTTGGQSTAYEYEPTGDLKKVTQPDGSWVAYGYDAARRLTGVSDSAGNSIEYTLDNAGNRTKEEVKDPGGVLARQLQRVYDALGRVQQSTGRE